MMSNVRRIYNFSDSKQAREFLDSLEMDGPEGKRKIAMIQTESGKELFFKDMDDEQSCHYAIELARMFKIKEHIR